MWTVENGWTVVDDEGWVCSERSLDRKDLTFYIYKDDEIWRFRNGRCRKTTFKRFEDLMRKALKLAQKTDLTFFEDDGVYTPDGGALVCDEHLRELRKLGFVRGEKIIIPEKFNAAQKEYALLNVEDILVRIDWMKEE